MSASVEIPVANSESAPAENLLDYEERFLDKDRKFLKRYMMKPPMGYALLLGCKQYDDTDQPLLCVDKDLNSMTKVLNEIGIEEANSGSRTTKEDYERMKHSLLSKKDLNKYSCFMLYYSGHGSPDGLLLYPNHEVPFKHVLEMVQGIPALHGKPKILIFDCCRGNDDCNTAGLDFMESSTFGDMIVCFACTHNAVSINVVLDGSVFTQHFVVALREFRHETSFVDLLDQAKGNTFQVVRSLFDRRQQAVSYNYLNAQLMLRGEEKICIFI